MLSGPGSLRQVFLVGWGWGWWWGGVGRRRRRRWWWWRRRRDSGYSNPAESVRIYQVWLTVWLFFFLFCFLVVQCVCVYHYILFSSSKSCYSFSVSSILFPSSSWLSSLFSSNLLLPRQHTYASGSRFIHTMHSDMGRLTSRSTDQLLFLVFSVCQVVRILLRQRSDTQGKKKTTYIHTCTVKRRKGEKNSLNAPLIFFSCYLSVCLSRHHYD